MYHEQREAYEALKRLALEVSAMIDMLEPDIDGLCDPPRTTTVRGYMLDVADKYEEAQAAISAYCHAYLRNHLTK